jgi:hypothetical protein
MWAIGRDLRARYQAPGSHGQASPGQPNAGVLRVIRRWTTMRLSTSLALESGEASLFDPAGTSDSTIKQKNRFSYTFFIYHDY